MGPDQATNSGDHAIVRRETEKKFEVPKNPMAFWPILSDGDDERQTE
jgi:hypothetical protein